MAAVFCPKPSKNRQKQSKTPQKQGFLRKNPENTEVTMFFSVFAWVFDPIPKYRDYISSFFHEKSKKKRQHMTTSHIKEVKHTEKEGKRDSI